MIKSINFLKVDLRRNLLSLKAILCIMAIALLFVIFSYSFYRNAPAIYIYSNRILRGSFILPLIYLLAAIPGAVSFCLDTEHNFTIYAINRGDIRIYCWSKFLANAVSSFAVSFTGLSLYCMALVIFFDNPVYREEQIAGMTYHWEFYRNQEWMYYTIHNLLVAAASVFWSTIALTVSAFIREPIVIFSLPIVANYLIERASTMYLPYYFDLYSLTLGASGKNVAFPYNIIYTLFLFSALSMICGNIFVARISRRKMDGFN